MKGNFKHNEVKQRKVTKNQRIQACVSRSADLSWYRRYNDNFISSFMFLKDFQEVFKSLNECQICQTPQVCASIDAAFDYMLTLVTICYINGILIGNMMKKPSLRSAFLCNRIEKNISSVLFYQKIVIIEATYLFFLFEFFFYKQSASYRNVYYCSFTVVFSC